jgi:RecB family exonuclease
VTNPKIPRRLSPTSLDRYRACPRRFLWQDIERRPFEELTTPETVLGTAVHKALENFFRLDVQKRDLETLHRQLRDAWKKHRGTTFASKEEEKHWGRQALALLSQFIERFDLTIQPIRVEQPLEIPLKSGGALVTRIDRIDPGHAGGVRLRDYKTGQLQLDSRDIPYETAPMVHLVAVEKAGKEVERVSLLYLRSGEEVYWEPERDDIQYVADRLNALLRQLGQEKEFAPIPGAGCRLCPYVLQCDAAVLTVDDRSE